MKKKILQTILSAGLAASMLLGSCMGAMASDEKADPVTLKFATGNAEVAPALNTIFAEYNKEHPNVSVEVTVLPGGVAGFNSAMASKLAAGDAPDIFMYQWGSQINAYAKGGNLMDVTDTGIKENLNEIKRPMNVYEGREYGYPIDQQFWGLMYNTELAANAGVTETPKTYDQFYGAMDKNKESGLEYPFIIPGKDGSGATGFVFCYLHQVVSGKNPDFYYQCCTGEKSWDGEEWRGLFEVYDKILDYANPDSLGLDPDNALTRFARGEGAFMVSAPASIKRLEEMNPDLVGKLKYIPFPLYETEEEYTTIADFDTVLSIWSGTKYPEEALDVYKYLFTPENNTLIAQSRNNIPVVKGADTSYVDPSLQDQLPLLEEGRYVGFSEREWIPGIKEIMKTIVQEWMGGTDLDTTLANLEKEHQRLLDADPEFLPQFEEFRSSIGE